MAVLLAYPTLGESLTLQDDLVDIPYRVTVGEKQIPVEIGTQVVRSYTARFRYEAGARVIVHHPGWNDVSFKPARFSDSAIYTSETVSFEMTDASPTVVKAPGQPPLFLIATSAANPPDNADRIKPNSDEKVPAALFQAIDVAGESSLTLEPDPLDSDAPLRAVFKSRDANQFVTSPRTRGKAARAVRVSIAHTGEHINDVTYFASDVAQLPVGIYRITVQIADQAANAVVSRDTLFRIVAP